VAFSPLLCCSLPPLEQAVGLWSTPSSSPLFLSLLPFRIGDSLRLQHRICLFFTSLLPHWTRKRFPSAPHLVSPLSTVSHCLRTRSEEYPLPQQLDEPFRTPFFFSFALSRLFEFPRCRRYFPLAGFFFQAAERPANAPH